LKIDDENKLDFAVGVVDVIECLLLHVLTSLALRDLANQRRQRACLAKCDICLLVELILVFDVECTSLHERPDPLAESSIVCQTTQFGNTMLEVVTDAGLDLIVKLGFTHAVDIYDAGLVIVFEPSNFRLAEFNQPVVEA
jgi:hypothetical protein